ncbi:MAG: hypothetical protein EOM12_02695 [Verrucomicrobiae bacterium]|nr:hypothetical protein [Verrucomicrobiae bacterium]
MDTRRAAGEQPLAALRAEVQATLAMQQELPALFSAAFRYHMKRLGFADLGLASLMLCSDKSVQRYRSHEEHTKKREEVLKACVVFRLPYVLCEDLMRKAGLSFRPIADDLCVQNLLMLGSYTDIYDFNRQLEAIGGKALGLGR